MLFQGLYDLGNVGAVMRSADAFGVHNVHIINSLGDRFKATRAVSTGAERWLNIQRWNSVAEGVHAVKQQGIRVVAADARPSGSTLVLSQIFILRLPCRVTDVVLLLIGNWV